MTISHKSEWSNPIIVGSKWGFKISTLSAGDVVRVNIFKNNNAEEMTKLYHFFMTELVARNVLEKI